MCGGQSKACTPYQSVRGTSLRPPYEAATQPPPPCLRGARVVPYLQRRARSRRRGIIMKRIVAALLLASACGSVAKAQDTIRVGWTIPAEESKYWMMRRPEKFPNLGKGYKIEWSQFQGTSPMTQALIAGALDCATQGVLPIAQSMDKGTLATYVIAQHVGEKPGSFSVYWAVKDDSPIKKVEDLKGKTVGISIIGGGTQGPFNLMLKRHGLDPDKDIKLVEVSFSLSEDALRQDRVDAVNMNQPFAARAEAKGGIRKLFALEEAVPNIVHIVEACRKDFVDKNPELVKQYVKDITAGLKMALANREETMKVVSEITKAPVAVLDTYLLKSNDFAREPGAAPNYAAIQAMFDVYTNEKMIEKKLDAGALKKEGIVAPLEGPCSPHRAKRNAGSRITLRSIRATQRRLRPHHRPFVRHRARVRLTHTLRVFRQQPRGMPRLRRDPRGPAA